MSVAYQEYAGLTAGSKVVWVSDSGPEEGVVKWIGILPDKRQDDVIVGVEFVCIVTFIYQFAENRNGFQRRLNA